MKIRKKNIDKILMSQTYVGTLEDATVIVRTFQSVVICRNDTMKYTGAPLCSWMGVTSIFKQAYPSIRYKVLSLIYCLIVPVNRLNLTNLRTNARINCHRFLAIWLRAINTLHRATTSMVLNVYLIFLSLQVKKEGDITDWRTTAPNKV